MANTNGTTNEDMPPCAPDVYANGTLVLMTHTIGSEAMEGWVRQVAECSGQRVDWHFAGGRACVLALGDLPRVHAAIQELMPEHDRLQSEAAAKYQGPGMPPYKPYCTVYEVGTCNPAHELARQTVLSRGGRSAVSALNDRSLSPVVPPGHGRVMPNDPNVDWRQEYLWAVMAVESFLEGFGVDNSSRLAPDGNSPAEDIDILHMLESAGKWIDARD